ncbi:hypothetical protein CBOM_07436 [Ceraceosorus bombacis]|uniref:Uncharacterized protein n=1 Tax=Ceraceosorus bombacis TaxID=401625 RepID=A0A0P1BDR0_9BASI|nr:hypothetical protein CBOM_07436 [Ceraceosorus bombacis]
MDGLMCLRGRIAHRHAFLDSKIFKVTGTCARYLDRLLMPRGAEFLFFLASTCDSFRSSMFYAAHQEGAFLPALT